MTRSPLDRQSALNNRNERPTIMRLLYFLALLTTAAASLAPVDELRQTFYDLEKNLWKNVTNPKWSNAGLGGDVELSKAFVQFIGELNKIQTPSRPITYSWMWQKVSEKLLSIDDIFKELVFFLKQQVVPGAVPAPVKDWLDIAESVLMDPKTSVILKTAGLQELLEHGDLFRNVLQEQHPYLCNAQMSPHQLIFDLYNTIALTEIKGYAMMQFSWMLLRVYGKGNYTQEANLTRQRYADRTGKTALAAKAALEMASRDIYRCDPPKHVEGETYAQVTRFLQGYIENEVDMNKEASCSQDCGFYTLTQNYGCFKDQFCRRQSICKGRILNCRYIDSDMWVCPARKNSTRRYEWIEYENGRTLGKAGYCIRGITRVDSWWLWYLRHCSYCMCLCEEMSSESDRFFSLRPSVTDVAHNKVVNGMRIVKLGRVFHLQVSEATLGERGKLTLDGWVPVEKYDPLDHGVTEGVDFHTLTYEKRAVDLDELDSPAGSILTGIRFRMHGPNLHFEIRSTPFNYSSGKLVPEKSQWISNDNTGGAAYQPRTQLKIYHPDIPTRTNGPLPVDSKHDQYIEFTPTDLDADAAQTTVPYLDIQPILPQKGYSLASGAGLIHRGLKQSSGFIALKMFSYDYSRHVAPVAPPTDIVEDIPISDFPMIIN